MLAITMLAGSGIMPVEKLPASSPAAKLARVLPERVSPGVPLPGGLVMFWSARDREPVAEVTPGPPRAPAMTIGDVAGAVKLAGPFITAPPLPTAPLRKTGLPNVTVRSTAPVVGLVNVIVPVYASCWIFPPLLVAAALVLKRVKDSRAARFVAPSPIVPIVTALKPGNAAELVVRVVVLPTVVPVTVPLPNCVNDIMFAALADWASPSETRQATARFRIATVRIDPLLKVVIRISPMKEHIRCPS